jgi:hypothetical protein
MDVHASPDLLPELDAFLSTFKLRFRRPEVEAALERYLTGLLTELPNKNCDTMAQAVPGTHEQRLQGFLTTMQWDEEALNRQRVEKMIAAATIGNGVLIFDDTGFAKQGQASVGVARQYSGTLGKVGNCQVAVTCCRPACETQEKQAHLADRGSDSAHHCSDCGGRAAVNSGSGTDVSLGLTAIATADADFKNVSALRVYQLAAAP